MRTRLQRACLDAGFVQLARRRAGIEAIDRHVRLTSDGRSNRCGERASSEQSIAHGNSEPLCGAVCPPRPLRVCAAITVQPALLTHSAARRREV